MAILFPQMILTAPTRNKSGAGLRFLWRKRNVAPGRVPRMTRRKHPRDDPLPREFGRKNAKLQTEKFTNRPPAHRKAKRRM